MRNQRGKESMNPYLRPGLAKPGEQEFHLLPPLGDLGSREDRGREIDPCQLPGASDCCVGEWVESESPLCGGEG